MLRRLQDRRLTLCMYVVAISHHTQGREYTRLQRVFADGRMEVLTQELPSSPPPPPPPSVSPSSAFPAHPSRSGWGTQEMDHDTSGSNRFKSDHFGVKYRLVSGDYLRVGDILSSSGSSYAAWLDPSRGSFVVEQMDNREVIWESPSLGVAVGSNLFQALLSKEGRLEVLQGNRPIWRSPKGGPREDWSTDFRYVLTIEESDGNIVVSSAVVDDRECVWASFGCPDDVDAVALRQFGRRVIGPLLRQCGLLFCRVKDGLLVSLPEQLKRPEVKRGVKRLQALMKTTGKALKNAFRLLREGLR